MNNDEIMLKIENVSKVYRLGEIGGTTLRDELQRVKAKILHKEDPTKKIGAKNYNKGEMFSALNNVSFIVKKGERIGIIGHNGAGKSTLLKLISRVTGPTEGKIYLNGRVASMLEVGTGFHPELTGRENVYMNGAILGMTKKEIDAKMEEIIEFSEVRQFIDTPVKRYSSGMYVKLAFSVAAHLDSEIMIMDEVLAVGDMAFQKKCLAKMKSVSEEKHRTILYVSHNMNTIRELCDRVIVLDKGKIAFDGSVENGIPLYYGNALDQKTHRDFSKIIRPETYTKNIIIDTLDILNDSFELNKGDKLKISIRFHNTRPVSNVIFRIIFYSNFLVPIATIYAAEANYESLNHHTRNLELDTSEFAPGSYLTRLTIYSMDGKEAVIHDSINEAFTFNVVSNKVWVTSHWGNFHLPNAKDITWK